MVQSVIAYTLMAFIFIFSGIFGIVTRDMLDSKNVKSFVRKLLIAAIDLILLILAIIFEVILFQ